MDVCYFDHSPYVMPFSLKRKCGSNCFPAINRNYAFGQKILLSAIAQKWVSLVFEQASDFSAIPKLFENFPL
jgi:hypothetical protein